MQTKIQQKMWGAIIYSDTRVIHERKNGKGRKPRNEIIAEPIH